MKIQKLKKIVLTGLTAGLAIIAASAYAQFQDSSAGTNALRGNPVILQKYLPPPPAPLQPIVITNAPVIQQINGAELVDSTSDYVTGTNCGFREGTAQWMLSCGKRACESFGYTSGNVVEYFGGSVTLSCLR